MNIVFFCDRLKIPHFCIVYLLTLPKACKHTTGSSQHRWHWAPSSSRVLALKSKYLTTRHEISLKSSSFLQLELKMDKRDR